MVVNEIKIEGTDNSKKDLFSTYFIILLDSNKKIYQEGYRWIYSYQYQLPIPKEKNNDTKISPDDLKQIDYIEINVVTYKDATEDQLFLQYQYPPLLSRTAATIIEDNEQIWIHPPRDFFFKILELNPFPYIKKPFVIGNKWSWKLEIGERYSDARWLEWKGNLENMYHYEIVADTILNTSFGNLYCYITEAIAINEYGTTKLISYFNEYYGFIILDYTNIDSSKLSLELTSYKVDAEKLY